jgi:arylsulfatase A-like enzyme
MKIQLKHNLVWLLPLAVSCQADRKAKTGEIINPNILFVSIDDLNDWVGYMGGHPQAKTPNLDRFARLSVRFNHAYCTNPACNPSRASIMTGLAPHHSGVYSNYQDWREVIKEPMTMGHYFRDNGYFSAGAGKIFHYHMIDSLCWDSYWPSQKQNMPADFMPQNHPGVAEDEMKEYQTINMPMFKNMYTAFDWAAMDVSDSVMGDFRSVAHVSGLLEQKHDKPFFLACGIYRPHLPWYVPKKYFDMFPLDSVRLPVYLDNDLDDVGDRVVDIAQRSGNYHKHVLEAGLWKEAVQGYLASIAFADAMFGKLMDALESSDFAKNTVVVVWSDHGWQLGEKEHWRKFALWENVVQTNLMFKIPEGIKDVPEGSFNKPACDRIVSLQDLYPTLVDLCNLPVNQNIDGRSLVPLLQDPSTPWDYPAVTSYDFSEFSVRTEDWRYTTYIDGSEELYDHRRDPNEWFNLAGVAGYADIKANMKRHVPADPTPLVKTSEKLMLHHDPPFRTQEEYLNWLAHGKDNAWRIQEYWQ